MMRRDTYITEIWWRFSNLAIRHMLVYVLYYQVAINTNRLFLEISHSVAYVTRRNVTEGNKTNDIIDGCTSIYNMFRWSYSKVAQSNSSYTFAQPATM